MDDYAIIYLLHNKKSPVSGRFTCFNVKLIPNINHGNFNLIYTIYTIYQLNSNITKMSTLIKMVLSNIRFVLLFSLLCLYFGREGVTIFLIICAILLKDFMNC